ncbi:MAG TPA: redoxin domain-containing protein, partial [Pyrinomonadaceae bacterium]|nr:redoxin domain-containing protein [Pyrinomonadaceae bacterium]
VILVGTFALLVFVLSTTGCSTESDYVAVEFPVGTKLESFSLPDLEGSDQSLDKLNGENGVVLVFVSAQCPVVKTYNERINQVADELAAKGIRVIGINSNAPESLDWVKSNASEVGYKFPVLIDKGNILADKLGATVTPEFYYFDKQNVLLYHGALDNDRSGKNVTINYLRDAFDSALDKKPIQNTKTNAFGCSIKRA